MMFALCPIEIEFKQQEAIEVLIDSSVLGEISSLPDCHSRQMQEYDYSFLICIE